MGQPVPGALRCHGVLLSDPLKPQGRANRCLSFASSEIRDSLTKQGLVLRRWLRKVRSACAFEYRNIEHRIKGKRCSAPEHGLNSRLEHQRTKQPHYLRRSQAQEGQRAIEIGNQL